MRIGSGVQSVSELFGKRQNNSKTSVNGNEAFPQTSMKVYLKTDDMLFSEVDDLLVGLKEKEVQFIRNMVLNAVDNMKLLTE